jgi:hypothetical protein
MSIKCGARVELELIGNSVRQYLPVEDFGHRLHDGHDEVLYEEISVFGFENSMLHPFYPLADSIFIQSQHKDLALDDET